MRRSFSILEVLLVVALLAVLAAFGAVALFNHQHQGSKTKCSNTIRQVGLAAIQYGDDKRFLPHFNAIRTLDGDDTSPHTPTSVRALVWYGYHDNPEGFICPESDDEYVPITATEVRDNMRLWGWSGAHGQPDGPRDTTPPWRDGGAGGDTALVASSELSYAYTRRGYNKNVASTRVIGADRGTRASPDLTGVAPGDMGNRHDGWNVLRADCTVEFVFPEYDFGTGKPAYEFLIGETKGEGFLPLSDVARPK